MCRAQCAVACGMDANTSGVVPLALRPREALPGAVLRARGRWRRSGHTWVCVVAFRPHHGRRRVGATHAGSVAQVETILAPNRRPAASASSALRIAEVTSRSGLDPESDRGRFWVCSGWTESRSGIDSGRPRCKTVLRAGCRLQFWPCCRTSPPHRRASRSEVRRKMRREKRDARRVNEAGAHRRPACRAPPGAKNRGRWLLPARPRRLSLERAAAPMAAPATTPRRHRRERSSSRIGLDPSPQAARRLASI